MSSSSDFIEFLEPGTVEAVEVVNDGEDALELQLTQEVSIVETVVPEDLELLDLGPVPDFGQVSSLYFIKHDGVEYAPRSSVTLDPERVVVWIGPVQPAIDATYALNNVDVFWNTGA